MAHKPKNFDLYDFTDYKVYLAKRLDFEKIETKNIKLKFAEHTGCHPSYLSQVLNGKPQLTIDQAIRANDFFSHNKQEARYFILLLEHSKAATKQSRDFFAEQIAELKEEKFNLKKRLVSTEDVDPQFQNKYYSTWYYTAIHMLLLVPEFQNPKIISTHLNLPLEIVRGVIDALESAGLIVQKKGRFEFTKKRIFLDRNSDFIQRHHINWRSQALQAVEKNFAKNMHYSNITAISRDDFVKIKDLFLKAIENARELIGPSKEEAVYAISLDIFEV